MPTEESMNTIMNTYGISPGGFNFSWPNLMAGFIFGIVGWYAFNYGRKNQATKALIIGLVLMVYPYFVSSTILLCVIGVVLTALLFIWRD